MNSESALLTPAWGSWVFLNSHLLSEVESVCDRVAILHQGLVARQGTLSELTEHTVEYRIATTTDASRVRESVERLGGKYQGGRIVVSGRDAARVNGIIDLLRREEYLIEWQWAGGTRPTGLEDVFVEIIVDSGQGVRAPLSLSRGV